MLPHLPSCKIQTNDWWVKHSLFYGDWMYTQRMRCVTVSLLNGISFKCASLPAVVVLRAQHSSVTEFKDPFYYVCEESDAIYHKITLIVSYTNLLTPFRQYLYFYWITVDACAITSIVMCVKDVQRVESVRSLYLSFILLNTGLHYYQQSIEQTCQCQQCLLDYFFSDCGLRTELVYNPFRTSICEVLVSYGEVLFKVYLYKVICMTSFCISSIWSQEI